MLIQVFDHAGVLFEVRPDVAKRLVIMEGWTMENPKLLTGNHPAETPILELHTEQHWEPAGAVS